MDENFNFTLLVIVNTPIEISDLFKRAAKMDNVNLTLEPPEIRVGPGIGPGLTITPGNPSFRFPSIIAGNDLLVFNIVHSDAKRGAFQIEVKNTKGMFVPEELYKKLHEFVTQLGFEDVFAYEVVFRFITDTQIYPTFKEISGLKTMKEPKFASLRILDGYSGQKDLREELVSEIKIEGLSQPLKSQVSTLHRFKEFEENKLKEIVDDIDKVINLMG